MLEMKPQRNKIQDKSKKESGKNKKGKKCNRQPNQTKKEKN